MTKATNNVARVAAAVAGFGLVAISFAPLAQAQTATTATTTTTTTTTAMFTRDLTLGSTGADVTALQTWLIAKGYSIPAGATGYFGAQTKAALAAYQAASMITPAAGYFGPITRAKVMADNGTGTTTTTSTVPGCMPGAMFSSTTGKACTGSTTTTTTSTTLSGDEADLRDFDLLAEDGEGAEGESEVEAATAQFDVDGGDVSVQRAELTLHANVTTSGISQKPWDYIDSVSVWSDGKKVGEMDASDRDEWDEEDNDEFSGGSTDMYTISIDDIDAVVKEGDTAELTFAFDINDNIDDTDVAQQSFDVAVLEDGIRAIDAKGIQQYTGSDTDETQFSFSSEENGDISVRESNEDPDATTLKVEDDQTSDEYTVFAFDVRNSDDADTMLNELTIGVSTTPATSLTNVIRKATLSVDGDESRGDISNASTTINGNVYNGSIDFDDLDTMLDGESTTHFELMVEFAAQTGSTYVNATKITFGVDADSFDAEGDESGDDVEANDLNGSAVSSTHTLSTTGFNVMGDSTSSKVVTPGTNSASSYGQYTINFSVTADEDDDLYIPSTAGVASTSASTTGATFNILGDAFVGTTTASLVSNTADSVSGGYRVSAGDTEDFTLTVTLDPTASGQFRIELESVRYSINQNFSNGTTFSVDNDNAKLETNNEFIPS